jgi:hypothetical protein
VLPGCVLDLFLGWYNGLGKVHSKIWNMVLIVFSGPYGVSGMVELSRIRSERIHKCKNFFLIPCMIGP